MARELYDIEIEEITLCKSPANRKKFFIKKSKEDKTMSEFIDKLKKYLAESDEDVETALTKEQVEKIEKLDSKAQKEIEDNLDVVSQYEDIPDELESVHQFLFKQIVNAPELEKAGAKLSKTTQAQIKEALGHIKDGPKAVTILEALLGIEAKKTEKKKEGDEKENLSAETVAKLEEYEELKKVQDEELKKETAQKQQEMIVETVNKALKDAGLDEIPRKKSIDSDDEDEDKDTKKKADDAVDNYPSIPIPVLGG